MIFHHTTQNGMQLKIYKLFTSGIFRLVLLDHGCPRVTETVESETADKGDYDTYKVLDGCYSKQSTFHLLALYSTQQPHPSLILLCNGGYRDAQIVKVMHPGNGGTKPRCCPSGVCVLHHYSSLGKNQNSQLFVRCWRILGPRNIGRARLEKHNVQDVSS